MFKFCSSTLKKALKKTVDDYPKGRFINPRRNLGNYPPTGRSVGGVLPYTPVIKVTVDCRPPYISTR